MLKKKKKKKKIFQNLQRCLLYVVFHNLERFTQNAGLVEIKKDLNYKKRSNGIFVRKSLKKIASLLKCNWV